VSLDGKTVLVTGATGSFGRRFISKVLAEYEIEALRIFSRDELKQWNLQQEYPGEDRLRYLLGDVRDLDRLRRAFRGVDVVVHAAALKQVPACEYNPFEAVKTNVIGSENVIRAALDTGVKKVIAVSSDKAVAPANLYGATKLCAEKLFSRGNAYAGDLPTRFACARYGNVAGSSGSVIPLFRRQADSGFLTITDPRATRFLITLDQAVDFVISCIERMCGGEVAIPKLPSVRISDVSEAIAPGVPTKVVGMRPGEKLHEVLVTAEEARHTIELDDRYLILPEEPTWKPLGDWPAGRSVPEGFIYSSDANTTWLGVDEIRKLAESI
jgi:UDP-N-acetylglucosamine 4,6-dehydratase